MTAASQQWLQLREENENLRCQMEAYKNEVEVMKMEKTYGGATNHAALLEASQDADACRKKVQDKDKQINVLQQTLKGMQQVRNFTQYMFMNICIVIPTVPKLMCKCHG